MRGKARKERLAGIKERRKRRERDSDDEREDADRKKQKKEAEKQKREQHALNLDLPVPHWESLPLAIKKDFWTGPRGEQEVSEELKQRRKALGVLVKGNTALCPPPVDSVHDTGLPELFAKYFTAKNMQQPTVVQKQCWPALLSGANVLGIAPTGSGKTLAYSLPALHHIQQQQRSKLSSNKVQPRVLVLVPTRELAIQVHAVLKSCKGLVDKDTLQSGLLYGGQDKDTQVDTLRSMGAALKVLVATPGRLIDLLDSRDRPLDLSLVTYQVIDEADRMLSLGFAEQLDAIAKQLRPGRQVVLFSATFPGRLRELSEQWAPDAVSVRCSTIEVQDFQQTKMIQKEQKEQREKSAAAANEGAETSESVEKKKKTAAKEGEEEEEENKEETAQETDAAETAKSSSNITTSAIAVSSTIKQHIHVCAAHKRPRLLIKFIERVRAEEKANKQRQADPMIIFCNKIKTLNFVAHFLTKQKIQCVPLHGQLPQQLREDNLNSFRSGKVSIVVSTDVAARGLHVKRLKYVVNYDFPPNIEQYCHRIGRCGRQGAEGEAYSLLTRSFAAMAADLVDLLKTCQQDPEPNLERLAAQFALGEVDTTAEGDEGPDENEEEEEEEEEEEDEQKEDDASS